MYVETSSMYGYENFLCGFKLGASLMLEILKGEDGPEVWHTASASPIQAVKSQVVFSPLCSENLHP